MVLSKLVVQCVLIFGITWLLWRLLRSFVVGKSPLDNIPGPISRSFWVGNLNQLFSRDGSDFHREIAQEYGPVVRMQGLLSQPLLYVYDPKALHTMIIKEQQTYEVEELFIKSNRLIFGPGLVATVGDPHRKQRKILNPVFSVNHMRNMLPIFYRVTRRLCDALSSRVSSGPQELDFLGWMGRISLELIGQGGLGHSFDPLVQDPGDNYANALKDLVPSLLKLTLLRQCLPYVSQLGPVWLRRYVIDIFPNKDLQRLKSIVDVMHRRSTEIYEAKKLALLQGDESISSQITGGKDIMSVLMKTNTTASEADMLSEEEIIAQITSFIYAATDTTSNTLARIFELLAGNPTLQDNVRKEVLQLYQSGEPSYDELMGLPYLDAICRETLRIHPPDDLIIRQPNKDVILPLSEPVQGIDGSLIYEIPIPKGTKIFLGVLGSNTNKSLWGEDAWEWKPERWLTPLPSTLAQAPIPGVYSNLMTFLGGGRACIGFKFSELEMKVVLSMLLTTFTFQLTDKPIVWNFAPIRYPTVGTESNIPRMPLKVGLVDDMRL